MDLIAAIENQSRAEGINLGMAKGKAETACNMLHDGVDDAVDEIHRTDSGAA